MNGYLWEILFVDPTSPELMDRTGNMRVATTDPLRCRIYISRLLRGDFLKTVLLHELGHAVMISYNLLGDIHRMVSPGQWIEAEEWICNFLADYGDGVFSIAKGVLDR